MAATRVRADRAGNDGDALVEVSRSALSADRRGPSDRHRSSSPSEAGNAGADRGGTRVRRVQPRCSSAPCRIA